MNSKPEPANFEKLSQKLSAQTYAELNNQWRLKIIEKEKRTSRIQAEEKLVETVKPELIQLIKKQRLNYMVAGTRFIQIDQVFIYHTIFININIYIYLLNQNNTYLPILIINNYFLLLLLCYFFSGGTRKVFVCEIVEKP